ncbi:MAG: hypothetical protein H7095_01365 [Pseudopedobacter sp.]|nr:hypothetical protein [Deinococcales bacterium]
MSRLEQILKMDRSKVRIINLDDWREEDDIRENLEFWLSCTPEERLVGLEDLRAVNYGEQLTRTRTESRFSGLYPFAFRKIR